jgi:hypothetical protein
MPWKADYPTFNAQSVHDAAKLAGQVDENATYQDLTPTLV